MLKRPPRNRTLTATPYAAALAQAAAALHEAGIESPRREARLLLAHLLNLPARGLPPPSETPVDTLALHAAVGRRAAHEPLAYMTGRRGFWTFEVEVSRATLIPRPDTETLIEAALQAHPNHAAVGKILDLGTGTGCLLIAALVEFPSAWGVGLDRVPQAAALAAANAARITPDRAAFMAANWTAALCTRFDLILCNPPYIPTPDLAGLMPGVALHEPATALDGGPTGLDAYATLLPAMPALLNPGGTAIFELGAGQSEAAIAMAKAAGFSHITCRPDLAGIPRALALHAPA